MKNIVQKISKKTWGAFGLVVLVVAVGLFLQMRAKNKAVEIDLGPLPQEEMIAPTAPKPKAQKPAPIVEQADSRSYAELMVAYKGKTLQFGAACQMPISSYVYKTGTEVLLDNRTNTARTIKLAGMTYDLSAYGYKVVTLSTVGKFLVSCGDNQNVATVTVQQ